MRRKSGRARIERAGGEDQPEMARVVGWEELSAEEQLALKRLNRGHDPQLDPTMAERLLALGLVAQRPQGIGISRAGRELVIDVLLKPDT